MIAIEKLLKIKRDLPAPESVPVGKEIVIPFDMDKKFLEPGEKIDGILLKSQLLGDKEGKEVRAWVYMDLIVKCQEFKPTPFPGKGDDVSLECSYCGTVCEFEKKDWDRFQKGSTYRCGECMRNFALPEKLVKEKSDEK